MRHVLCFSISQNVAFLVDITQKFTVIHFFVKMLHTMYCLAVTQKGIKLRSSTFETIDDLRQTNTKESYFLSRYALVNILSGILISSSTSSRTSSVYVSLRILFIIFIDVG